MRAKPEVLAHNIETVERLTTGVRDPRASYHQSLRVLAKMKALDPKMFTKSSIMVGIGETEAEVIHTMRDLREAGCDFLTIGQYLQPTKRHLPVHGFVHPDQFKTFEDLGKEMGFLYVASGPLVRSSYKAGEYYIRRIIREGTAE